jgi:ribosomal protein L40E
MSRPQSKYVRVNANSPEAAGQCDRCGHWYQQRSLEWQFEWSGTHIYNTHVLVCRKCLDIPQEQFRTIVLPPDPPPIINARPPNFAYEEQTVRIVQFAGPNEPPWGAGPQTLRCLQDGETPRILQYLTSS